MNHNDMQKCIMMNDHLHLQMHGSSTMISSNRRFLNGHRTFKNDMIIWELGIVLGVDGHYIRIRSGIVLLGNGHYG